MSAFESSAQPVYFDFCLICGQRAPGICDTQIKRCHLLHQLGARPRVDRLARHATSILCPLEAGRFHSPRLDGNTVRADLFIDPTAMKEPPGGGRPYGEYVLHLAKTDPDAVSASLVLSVDKVTDRDYRGPVLWVPKSSVESADLVSIGDANRGGIFGTGQDEIEAIRARHAERLADEDALFRLKWRHKKRMAGLA